MDRKSAIKAIVQAGVLLVFPVDNKKEPASIWSHFYPRRKMVWEWDEGSDHSVATLWHLRGELSTVRHVIYTKWYKGRATYFSPSVFSGMLRSLNPKGDLRESLSAGARKILEILEGESPLSTKELKRMADMKGKANEKSYNDALKELWSRLLIVAYGEVDDGAFPSLAVGSTRVLYEDLWRKSFALDAKNAELLISKSLSAENLFYQYYLKLKLGPKTQTKSKASKRPGLSGDNVTKVGKVIRFEDL